MIRRKNCFVMNLKQSCSVLQGFKAGAGYNTVERRERVHRSLSETSQRVDSTLQESMMYDWSISRCSKLRNKRPFYRRHAVANLAPFHGFGLQSESSTDETHASHESSVLFWVSGELPPHLILNLGFCRSMIFGAFRGYNPASEKS